MATKMGINELSFPMKVPITHDDLWMHYRINVEVAKSIINNIKAGLLAQQ